MAPMTTDTHGELRFTVPVRDAKFAMSGDPEAKGRWTMRGHAAVFNRKSHDLGGFHTEIDPSFFATILASNPDVHMLWDHDTKYVLARTLNGSLELTVDEHGLAVWAMFAKTATADECATLMAGGFIDQMSFACDIGEDVWYENPDGTVTRRLLDCAGLYDVTVCAQGAFPQTSSMLVASHRNAGADLASAREAGRVTLTGDSVAAEKRGEQQKDSIAQNGGAATVAHNAGGRDLAELKKWADAQFSAAPRP